MKIECTFDECSQNAEKVYRCLVDGQIVPENMEITFIGQHRGEKTNEDVLYVKFRNCTVTKVPQGLTRIFPNMKTLWITKSKLNKITKNDLIEYKNLKKLFFGSNEIEFLSGDLFEGFRHLELIGFGENKLKIIEPNILDGLEKLKYVDFRNNPNYGKFYTCFPYNGGNAKLDEIKAYLYLKYDKNSELYTEHPHREDQQSTYELQKGMVDDIKAFIVQPESFSDFNIKINDREFRVHKFLLAARSPTLGEYLRNNPKAKSYNLDISLETFEKILKFIYTDELPGDDGTNFLHLFIAAGKLKIEELKKFAAVKIIQLINEENALDILELSYRYDHEEMRFRAFAVLKEKCPNFNFGDEFTADRVKVDRFIAAFKRKQEAEREMREMFIN